MLHGRVKPALAFGGQCGSCSGLNWEIARRLQCWLALHCDWFREKDTSEQLPCACHCAVLMVFDVRLCLCGYVFVFVCVQCTTNENAMVNWQCFAHGARLRTASPRKFAAPSNFFYLCALLPLANFNQKQTAKLHKI